MARKLLPFAAPAANDPTPAAPSLLEAIKALGYDTVNVAYNIGQAKQILLSKPCTSSQIAMLNQHGYDTTQGATVGQYEAAMKEIQGT